MRGKAKLAVESSACCRITPAYAGKSGGTGGGRGQAWDHPRLCGEKLTQNFGRHKAAGSPPPMRGKAERKRLQIFYNRITPAYAGKRTVSSTAVLC